MLGMRWAWIAAAAIAIVREPHHSVVLQNLKVCVLRLKLAPGEATELHRHSNYYAFVGLDAVTLSNEVPGRGAKLTNLEAGELHTSRGGFELVERNTSNKAADIIVVELVNPNPTPFAGPTDGIHLDQALSSELFETVGMRAYALMVSANGHVRKTQQEYDRVVLALSEITLHRETGTATDAETFTLKPGEVKWLPRGGAEDMTNTGDKIARYVVFELN